MVGARRRSAQPPITRCQRRQAVIRRLNSRSNRSVFVRVNLHQVSIFRAFRDATGRDGKLQLLELRERRRRRRRRLRRRRAKSSVTTTVINNTSKNNGENIGNERAERPSVATAKAITVRRSCDSPPARDVGKILQYDEFPGELAESRSPRTSVVSFSAKCCAPR